MSLIKKHEKFVRKLSIRNLYMAIVGKLLAIISIGSIFSLKLVKYSYIFLILGVVISVYYLSKNFVGYDGHGCRSRGACRYIGEGRMSHVAADI